MEIRESNLTRISSLIQAMFGAFGSTSGSGHITRFVEAKRATGSDKRLDRAIERLYRELTSL